MINQLNILHTGRFKKKSSLLEDAHADVSKEISLHNPFIWSANTIQYLLCARYYGGYWNPQTTSESIVYVFKDPKLFLGRQICTWAPL